MIAEVHLLRFTGNISDGYIYDRVNKLFLKFHEVPTNWTNAVQICQKEGGRLFMADTKEKSDLIYELKGELISQFFYHLRNRCISTLNCLLKLYGTYLNSLIPFK